MIRKRKKQVVKDKCHENDTFLVKIHIECNVIIG